MYPYPGINVLDRATNAMKANPGVRVFHDLYLFVLQYSTTYRTKTGKKLTGRYGVDGAVKRAFGQVIASHVVR
ncbi:hypothetical protein A3849_08870 [Paenibacillus sp. P46E]|nr:hypothetical protein A3849_08870 [Paenibacillus sp. P46E]